MNNRYICKAKRKDNNEWVEGVAIFADNKAFILNNAKVEFIKGFNKNRLIFVSVEVIPGTVEQCSGVPDKNGKLIFEGDIVVTYKFNTPEVKYTIKYDKEIATFIGEYKKGCIKHFTTFDGDSDCFEVIGNIHDNPELLEVER